MKKFFTVITLLAFSSSSAFADSGTLVRALIGLGVGATILYNLNKKPTQNANISKKTDEDTYSKGGFQNTPEPNVGMGWGVVSKDQLGQINQNLNSGGEQQAPISITHQQGKSVIVDHDGHYMRCEYWANNFYNCIPFEFNR